MRRGRIRVAWLAASVVAILVVGILSVLRFTSPPPLGPPSESAAKELPEAWLDTESLRLTEAQTRSEIQDDPVSRPIPFSTTGRLLFYGDGRPLGEESYEIRVDERGASLVSTGEFRFKALVATIRVAFEQRLEADGRLAPTHYEAAFDAPLGMGRRVRVDLSGGVARIASGDEVREIPLGDDALVLGTFGSYALLPVLFPLRERDGRASFDVLVLGGPSDEQSDGDGPPRMTIERVPGLWLRADGLTLSVDAYAIRSRFGESLLLSREREFIALLAGDEGAPLAVYRSDFFPTGFEIVQGGGRPPILPFTTVP